MRKKTQCLKKSLLIASISALLLSCSGKEDSAKQESLLSNGLSLNQEISPEEAARARICQQQKEAVTAFVQSMDLVERYSQLFLVNLEGNREFTPVETFQWGDLPERDLVPGGYLFFSYNIAEEPRQVAEFTASIQTWTQHRGLVPPLLAVDQEGGQVNRLRKITSPLPSPKMVAQSLSVSQAQLLYAVQATQMKLLGFQMNLAPVVEAEGQHNSDFLESRSFGGLGAMEDFSIAAIHGFQSQGLAAVAKHFPGNTNDDPHSGLPKIDLSQQELDRLYLEPFRHVLQEGEPWAILMSHAQISVGSGTDAGSSAPDLEIPACLSIFWVTETLRNRFNYQGLILSDDIFMAALEKNGFPPRKAVMMALEAGVDVIMLSEKRFGSVLKLILDRSQSDPEFAALLDRSVERVVAAKVKAGLLAFQPVQDQSQEGLTLVPSRQKSWSQVEWDAAYRQGMELYTSGFGGGQ